jgi:hypothetical protein
MGVYVGDGGLRMGMVAKQGEGWLSRGMGG